MSHPPPSSIPLTLLQEKKLRKAYLKPTLAQVRAWQSKPRKPIARVSVKRKSQLNLYYKARKRFLAEHIWCAVFPELFAREVHHKAGRRGSALLDESNWLPVSRRGHRLIHECPVAARAQGWLV